MAPLGEKEEGVGNAESPVKEGGKFVSVRWKGRERTVKGAVLHFMEKDMFSDVHLFCDSHHFRCHRVVLSAGSEYFQDIFEATCIPACNSFPSVVVIANFKHHMLQYVLSYIYTGRAEVASEDWEEFMCCGHSMKLRGFDPSVPQRWTSEEALDFCVGDVVEAELSEYSQSSNESGEGTKRKGRRGRKPRKSRESAGTKDKNNGINGSRLSSKDFEDFQPSRIPTFGKSVIAKKRNSFVAPSAVKVEKNDGDVKPKCDSKVSPGSSEKKASKKRKSSPSTVTKPAPEERKPRKSPAVRRSENDGPDVILADILDTIDKVTSNSGDAEMLVEEIMSQYTQCVSEKNAESNAIDENDSPASSKTTLKTAKKVKTERGSKEDMEKLLSAAIKDVQNDVAVSVAASSNGVSLSTLRNRLKKMGITSTKRKSTGLNGKDSNTSQKTNTFKKKQGAESSLSEKEVAPPKVTLTQNGEEETASPQSQASQNRVELEAKVDETESETERLSPENAHKDVKPPLIIDDTIEPAQKPFESDHGANTLIKNPVKFSQPEKKSQKFVVPRIAIKAEVEEKLPESEASANEPKTFPSSSESFEANEKHSQEASEQADGKVVITPL